MPADEPTGLYDVYPQFSTGKKTIRRKGYTAHRRGKTIRVRSSRVKDMGAPGKWKEVRSIGPLKKGKLSSLGYDVTEKSSRRHRAIDTAVGKYGKLSTLRKLNAVRVYTRRTSPKKSKTFKSDVRYVQKKYY